MRTEASAAQASTLTVLVGSTTYVFSPGPDVIVGPGSQCHIRLDRPGDAGDIAPASEDLVLRFADTHWVAIDRSRDGIFVEGVQVSTVDIQDGQAITIGDPQQGPRLVFHIGPPPVTPQPAPPSHPVPTEQNTGQMRIPQLEPVTESPTGPLPLPATEHLVAQAPFPATEDPVHPVTQPPGLPEAQVEAPESPFPLEGKTDGTGTPLPARPEPRGTEPASTFRLPLEPDARTQGVGAYQLGLTADNVPGHEWLTDVSFSARPGTLTAVVGPSAARNSALLDLLSGARELSSGRVTVDGHDVHVEHESMRTRIGIVPRGDCVYPGLTVERVLTDAAKLRLPADTTADHRGRVVDQVLDELELTQHRKTRIRKLAPEVRRCASMAIELITRPTLLVVHEPGAGLDPAQAYHVLAMLRRQADIGCVVVAAMSPRSSPAPLIYLNKCDQLLLLTATGSMAFAGPPGQIAAAMGTTDWSAIIARMSSDPESAHRAYLARHQVPAPAPPSAGEALPPPAPLSFGRQTRFIVARQVRLLLASRVYLVVLVLLPVALAALTLLIPGNTGFARPIPASPNAHEAVEILAVLNIAAVIVGTALTVRDLVGERRIFRREQAVGLSTSAYLLGKIIVFGVVAALLAAILTTIVVAAKGEPAHGAVLLRNPAVELYLAVAATAVVSAIVGLAVSTLGNSLREVLLLLLPVILASLLFAGGLIPLVGTWGYDQVSWFIPAQWGFAASASTVDLHRVDSLAADAAMWTHYSGWWVFDMCVLLAFGALWAGFVRYRLRPPSREKRGQPEHRGHGEKQE